MGLVTTSHVGLSSCIWLCAKERVPVSMIRANHKQPENILVILASAIKDFVADNV
jgi:hypothetical protein